MKRKITVLIAAAPLAIALIGAGCGNSAGETGD
jgi:hypothetical protein